MQLWALFLQGRRNFMRLFVAVSHRTPHKPKLHRRNFFSFEKKLLSQMTMVIFLLMVFSVGLSAQRITISKVNVPLQTIFSEIEKQTAYNFFYNETLLEKSNKVTMDVKNVSVEEALSSCFRNQPLTYAMVNNTIVVKKREEEGRNGNVVANVASKKSSEKIGVSGKVTTQDGKPIVGATVTVKGTDIATSTDADGVFRFSEVEDNSTLVITNVAYLQQEVNLNKRVYLTVSLEEKVGNLDEAVVVAYNTTTQRSNVGAVTVVKGEQIQTLPNRSFDKSLQGLVPGLFITQGTGQPGGGAANFVLRGISTGGSADDGSTVRNPLIVIDGIPVSQEPAQATTNVVTYNNPMAQLNPSDIETISVLKDAAAIALYGSRASNGVILVTTKKGKSGKTIFNFRHQTDISERVSENAKMLNQKEYLELVYETFKNTNPGYYTNARIDSIMRTNFPTKPDGSFYPQVDWLNELYKSNATTVSNELSMSGGNEKSIFYLNLEYTKQNGIERNTGYDRKSIRFNYENKLSTGLRVGLNTAFSYNVQEYSLGWSEFAAASISPLNPIRDNQGDYIYNYTWGFSSNTSNINSNTNLYENPAAAQELNIKQNTSYRALAKLYGEANFFKYFTFTTSAGLDFMLTEAKEKIHPKFAVDGVTGKGEFQERDIRNASIIATNIVRYNRLFNKTHKINFLAGHEAQVLANKYMYLVVNDLSSNPSTIQLPPGVVSEASGITYKQTLLSYFSQINYGFRDKYFLSGSIRTDGSSLFGENKRFGSHWSAGAAWVMSSEPVFKGMTNWISYLKFRGSIGSAGNSAAIFRKLRYDRLILNPFFNGVSVYPDFSGSPGNPSVQWEKTFTWDAGIEIRFLKERISFTGDIYQKRTSKAIGSTQLPYATGYDFLTTNIGNIRNQGIELVISASIIKSKNFYWNLSSNWSKNKNKLTKSFVKLETIPTSGSIVNLEGENYNSFYLVRWAGVDPVDGKPQWLDAEGKITKTYNATADRVIVGKPQPDGFGAITNTFSYKGIDLSVMAYYQYGFQIYNNASARPLVNDGLDPFINQTKNALDRWQKPGDIAANPRRLLNGKDINNVPDNGTRASTRYLVDGDFIRLSNVTLAYNLPKRLLDRLHLSSFRVYIQGHNLAVWTKYTGRQDPENIGYSGTATYNYPLQRSYTFGLNLSF